MSTAITGPIAYRQFLLPKACEANQGHRHNYDHATFVHRGRVLITITDDDGKEVSSREYGAGEFAEIKATLHHKIKALDDNTVYYCIFSHRDFDGLVTQRYVGNAWANE